jgi:DNA-directed RNA polymerase subunit RPC12/RpoP
MADKGMAQPQKAHYRCMRCGHEWEETLEADKERMCAKCRSNSVRLVKAEKQST